MKVIEIENLSMEYRSHWTFKKKLALDRLNLTIEEGQIYGYLGANGSGKTTTIKILMSLLHPISGSAKILGKDIRNAKSRIEVGFLPENPYFYEYLTPVESLQFYGRLQHVPPQEIRTRSEKLLEMMGLQQAKDQHLIGFSKGMRQRFGFCQALINEPKLLILDEPISGLDPMGRKLFKDLILEQKRKGISVFFSSHILSDVEELCDSVAILVKGQLKKSGLVHELVSSAYSGFELQLLNASDAVHQFIQSLTSNIRFFGEKQIRCVLPPKSDIDLLLKQLQEMGAKIQALIPEKETLEEYFVRISSEYDSPAIKEIE
ncbi:MAG: ABC transporter ATP-binding protein [Planctomycetota bacterium]